MYRSECAHAPTGVEVASLQVRESHNLIHFAKGSLYLKHHYTVFEILSCNGMIGIIFNLKKKKGF